MEHLREVNAALLIERKREAEAAVKLVRGQAEKRMEQEEAKDGMEAFHKHWLTSDSGSA